jgi:hypothetical protein
MVLCGIAALSLSGVLLASAQSPEIKVTSPTPGMLVDGTTVTVTFEVVDFTLVPSTVPLAEAGQHPELNKPGEGHVHFMLDLGPLVVWERAEPYSFMNVPPGEHQLMAELVNNDHASFTPAIIQQINFRSNASQVMSSTGSDQPPAARGGLVAIAIVGFLALVAGLLLRRGYA